MVKHIREAYATIGSDDRRNCVLKSVALAGCMDYSTVDEVFTRHGRQRNRATLPYVSLAAMRELFPLARRYTPVLHETTKAFCESHRQGHYLVFVRGHAFALCDGVVFDWTYRPRAKVRCYWQLA
jgi:hypothetical protein